MAYVQRTARQCVTDGLTGLAAIPMDLGSWETYDPDWLDNYEALGPYEVWQEEFEEPLTDAQKRMKACEFLLVIINGVYDFIQIQQDGDPEYTNTELSGLASLLQSIADAAYSEFPPDPSSLGG